MLSSQMDAGGSGCGLQEGDVSWRSAQAHPARAVEAVERVTPLMHPCFGVPRVLMEELRASRLEDFGVAATGVRLQCTKDQYAVRFLWKESRKSRVPCLKCRKVP